MRMLTSLAAVLLLTSSVGSLPARSAERGVEAKVDAVILPMMRDKGIPGVEVAVVQNGRILLEKGYGTIDVGSHAPPTATTIFRLGSISKAFTAVGAMLLVDQGKISLDAPISTYLSDVPAAWRGITVRQFMTHTSGIPDVKDPGTWAQAMAEAARMPMRFAPGSNQEYVNTNFAVIGHLIEVRSGMSYSQYMRERVFTPLGLTQTGTPTDRPEGTYATGYEERGGARVVAHQQMSAYSVPSGGLLSTMDNMIAFSEAIRTRKLLSERAYREMFTPVVPPGSRDNSHYTPGWQERPGGPYTVISKNGLVDGFASMIQFVPQNGATLIILENASVQGGFLWKPSAAILESVFGVPRH